MILPLVALPFEKVRGIYTIRGQQYRMPDRALFLEPEAAKSFLDLAHILTVSDVYRSPEASLAAVRSKAGTKPPGYSAHNFGLAIDLDIKASMLALGVGKKAHLDTYMASNGWYCHRTDGKMLIEAWHYNYLGPNALIPKDATSTAAAIENKIHRLYGGWFIMDDREVQAYLKELKLYHGAIDGQFGPLSREATRAFQRAWQSKYLKVTGLPDPETKRTLAVVTAVKRMEFIK